MFHSPALPRWDDWFWVLFREFEIQTLTSKLPRSSVVWQKRWMIVIALFAIHCWLTLKDTPNVSLVTNLLDAWNHAGEHYDATGLWRVTGLEGQLKMWPWSGGFLVVTSCHKHECFLSLPQCLIAFGRYSSYADVILNESVCQRRFSYLIVEGPGLLLKSGGWYWELLLFGDWQLDTADSALASSSSTQTSVFCTAPVGQLKHEVMLCSCHQACINITAAQCGVWIVLPLTWHRREEQCRLSRNYVMAMMFCWAI